MGCEGASVSLALVLVPAGGVRWVQCTARHAGCMCLLPIVQRAQSDGLPRWGKAHVGDVGKVRYYFIRMSWHGMGYFWLASGFG